MTREEAIEVIKAYRDNLYNSASNQLDGDIQAFDMAISALEQKYWIDKEGNIKPIQILTHSTPIPDNATNGDVIKVMFPKDVKVITQHDDIFGRRFIDLRIGQLDCELDDEWWNASYQKGGKE